MNIKSNIENEIIKVLGYFDYFKFPLNLGEIHQFISVKIELSELSDQLKRMVEEEKINFIKECYLIPDSVENVDRKLTGFDLSQKRMKRARIISNLINWFPFVRMVGISGSLSKGYSDSKTDIDFFIITTNDNLWTSRTLLHLFKKLTFIFNLQHSFCMNYFIAENHLTLEEKNYFTAVELSTLIPIKGETHYFELMKYNNWISDYVPNFKLNKGYSKTNNPKGFKWVFEKLLSSNKLNKSVMNFTDKRWRKKWRKRGFPEEQYDLAFKTNLYESKNHPGNNQKKVLDHISEIKETKIN